MNAVAADQTFEEWCDELIKLFARKFQAQDNSPMDEASSVAGMYVDNARECFREMYDEGMSPLDAIEEEAFAAGD